MIQKEVTLQEQTLYSGRILSLKTATVRLENGAAAPREKVEHHGGVGVLPIDQEGFCFLVRQYRFGVDDVVSEIPAGKLEVGESPLECGIRELEEEIGFRAAKMEPLGFFYPTPAYCSEKIHLFAALSLTPVPHTPIEDEFLEIVKMPLRQAIQLAQQGKLPDAKTTIALLRCQTILPADLSPSVYEK